MKLAVAVILSSGMLLGFPAGARPAAPEPPTLRLPAGARPVRQSIDLTLDPAKETFHGITRIELTLDKATPLLWLNATELEVRSARLEAKGRTAPARVVPGGTDFVGFAFDAPPGPGPATLTVTYDGKVNRTEVEGVFALKEGDAWYLFTQFEAIAARKAFPCFDEPAAKIPWLVTVRVPKEQVAIANAPQTAQQDAGDGTKVLRFAETRPLPSYLVAVAVGPFDLVDLGPLGRNRVPGRLVVPKSRAADTRWARESTPPILGLLEDYFDRPYPYEKLDQVAIPGVGFAMEHPGLVTYGQGLMVEPAGQETVGVKQDWVSVAAHELAHMWFGDLVTTAWWDDIWLNEGFASWLGQKVTDRFRPEWELGVSRVADRAQSLRGDSLASARKIRQPIANTDDIQNSFDDITYGKAEAVLEMFEAWLGEDVFRRGVRGYLEAHAWGNATASDFLSALSAAAGRDVAGPFSTFLDQTGAPLVAARAVCGDQKIVLSQKPYRRLGSSDPGPKAWQVPVCVKRGAAGPAARSCALLASREEVAPLEGACPEWLFPNAGAAGYFLSALTLAEAERALSGDRLGLAERVGLLGDVLALARSGDLPAKDALVIAASQAGHPNPQVATASLEVVTSLFEIVPETLRPRYAAFIREVYGPRARALGWSSKPGEAENLGLLRRRLLLAVAGIGEDPDLAREAGDLARRWLDNPRNLDPNVASVALDLAARNGDLALFERYRSGALASQDRARREQIVGALGSFREPAALKAALGLALERGLDPRESFAIPLSAADDPTTLPVSYAFVKDNFAALTKGVPRDYGSFLPSIGAAFCDEPHRADVVAFFKDRSAEFPGGPRRFEQAVERIDQCVAFARAQGPSVVAFLESR